MARRLTITLGSEEAAALEQLAAKQVRPLKEQVRFLIRAEAERCGLLRPDHARAKADYDAAPQD